MEGKVEDFNAYELLGTTSRICAHCQSSCCQCPAGIGSTCCGDMISGAPVKLTEAHANPIVAVHS